MSLDMGCTWKFESSLFNCNELQSLESFSLTSFGSSVSRWEIYAVQVGTLDFFKLRRCLWIQKYVNIVARVNGTRYMRVSAVMVAVSIGQILDAWTIAVNTGRALKMIKQEIIYIAVDNKDAEYFLEQLCEPGKITDSYIRVDRMKKTLETINFQVRAVPLLDFYRFIPMSPIKIYLHSSKPFTARRPLLEDRYNEWQVIKMHLSTSAKEIDIETLIDILNGGRVNKHE